MSRRGRGEIPLMNRHAGGQARVRLNAQDVYLGKWGSPEALAYYNQIIAAWLENDRRWPLPTSACASVAGIGDQYALFARSYYVKRGRCTSTVGLIEKALELLYRCPTPHGYAEAPSLGQLPPGEFGPRALKAFQVWLAADDQGPRGTSRWARKTINEFARMIVQMFGWAVSEELVDESVWLALKSVRAIRRGRPPGAGVKAPRDGPPVDPVPDEDLVAARARMGPMLRAMVDLQLLTAMRPGEVVYLRGADLLPTIDQGVVCYAVSAEANKTDHHDIDRRVYIGPRGMDVLRPWLPEDPGAFVFSPRRAEALRNQAKRAARVVHRWPSHDPEHRRRHRGAAPARLGDRYDEKTYGRAIRRACVAAGVTPWSPNRLRHNAATTICERESIEVAQLILGHRDIKTTLRYVQVHDRRAIVAMLRHG